MKELQGIKLKDVQAVYDGPEGDLWELIMGEQIHIGGMASSVALAERADIRGGMKGIDLCCCSGAGMRFLLRMRGVSEMTGVDATSTVVDRGRKRCEREGLADRIHFVERDACDSGLPDGGADFVWGEDAWCYVEDKGRLIAEAVRLIRPGGTVAFTDWVEGSVDLDELEAERFLRFMKFPSVQDVEGYADLLRTEGCELLAAEVTGLFAPCVELYITMLEKQLGYDALKILGFDIEVMRQLAGEMAFTLELARAGKIVQGRFVARKA